MTRLFPGDAIPQAAMHLRMVEARLFAAAEPLDEDSMVVTLKYWGFAAAARHPFVTPEADHGLCDLRVYVTRRQILTAIFTLGLKRPVTVAWRAHAGILPLGDA